LNWEQCIICQCSNAEPVICMRDVGKDSFVRSMEIRREEVYSRILQEIHTLTGCNFMYFKIFLECFILTNETKITLNGLVLGRLPEFNS
jgi:hypothetical protein